MMRIQVSLPVYNNYKLMINYEGKIILLVIIKIEHFYIKYFFI